MLAYISGSHFARFVFCSGAVRAPKNEVHETFLKSKATEQVTFSETREKTEKKKRRPRLRVASYLACPRISQVVYERPLLDEAVPLTRVSEYLIGDTYNAHFSFVYF